MPTMTMAKALNAGLRRTLAADPKVLLAGEDLTPGTPARDPARRIRGP